MSLAEDHNIEATDMLFIHFALGCFVEAVCSDDNITHDFGTITAFH